MKKMVILLLAGFLLLSCATRLGEHNSTWTSAFPSGALRAEGSDSTQFAPTFCLSKD